MNTYKVAGLERMSGSMKPFRPFLKEVQAPTPLGAEQAALHELSEFQVQIKAIVPVTDVRKRVDEIASAYWRERFQPAGTWTDENGKTRHSSLAQKLWDEMGTITIAAAAENETTLIRCGVPERIARFSAGTDRLTLEATRLLWRGHVEGSGEMLDGHMPGLRVIEEWTDGFRWVWTDDERLIFTYCEGDLTGEFYFAPLAFSLAMNKAAEFYATH